MTLSFLISLRAFLNEVGSAPCEPDGLQSEQSLPGNDQNSVDGFICLNTFVLASLRSGLCPSPSPPSYHLMTISDKHMAFRARQDWAMGPSLPGDSGVSPPLSFFFFF